jgi:uronate dehydrogenase
MLATWLSYDDLERLVVASLTAPVVRHTVVYGLSDNQTRWWDNTPASHLGFRPRDNSEPWRAALESRQPALDLDDPANVRQGGSFVTKGPFD